MNRWITLALLTLAISAGASAEVYRWVDKSGTVQYSDVPPPDATAQSRKLIDNRIDVDKLPYETRKAVEKSPITLYTSSTCKDVCESARKHLQARKLPFAEKNLQTAEEIQALAKLVGKPTPIAPTLQIGSKTLEGYEQGVWNSALEAAGYPKAP